MRFTQEEFQEMVNELLHKELISYDMLCRIAEKTLRRTVVNWCNADNYLRGRGYEDDIMQAIHLRLIKTTVDFFLLKDGVEGSYNNNPEGFEDWLFRVAINIKRDFANKIRSQDFKAVDIDDPAIASEMLTTDYDYSAEEHIERLKWAFSVVISSDVGIYKILTWLAQFIFILEYNLTKIKSTERIIAAFENKTLNDMYNVILSLTDIIPWIDVTDEQNETILRALRKKQKNGVSYGETAYRDFFMTYNGMPSGKKSISDWMNRMKDMIKRKAGHDEE